MLNYERLNKILEEKNLSVYRVSKETGISQSSFNDWKRKKASPSYKKLKILSEYLQVDIEYLTGENDSRIEKPKQKEHMVSLPLYARLSCGLGSFVDEDILEYISMPDTILSPNKEYFANYAKGDSMIDANINDGDLLIFEKTNALENGDIGSFCVDNGEALCKRFRKSEQGLVVLLPANEKYDPIIVDIENACFRVVGKLALVISIR